MATVHYSWGIKQGGITSDGILLPSASSLVGVPEEFSGNLAIGMTTITFSAPTKTLHILNTDETDNFEVSFDGGTNWQTVFSLGDIKENLQVNSILLRATAADVSYHVIAGLNS